MKDIRSPHLGTLGPSKQSPYVTGPAWLLLLAVAACSLATNAEDFVSGVCPAPEKSCGDACVSDNDPDFGCSRPGCTACALPNAVSQCDITDTCEIGSCNAGFVDCDNTVADGCEVDTADDVMNCGACGCRCGTEDPTDCGVGQYVGRIANGTPGCVSGQCATGLCDPGWGDCDNDPTNGCETPTNTNTNCGACGGTACPLSEACVCLLLGGRTDCSCQPGEASVPDAALGADGTSVGDAALVQSAPASSDGSAIVDADSAPDVSAVGDGASNPKSSNEASSNGD